MTVPMLLRAAVVILIVHAGVVHADTGGRTLTLLVEPSLPQDIVDQVRAEASARGLDTEVVAVSGPTAEVAAALARRDGVTAVIWVGPVGVDDELAVWAVGAELPARYARLPSSIET